jgi:hypothetical protein
MPEETKARQRADSALHAANFADFSRSGQGDNGLLNRTITTKAHGRQRNGGGRCGFNRRMRRPGSTSQRAVPPPPTVIGAASAADQMNQMFLDMAVAQGCQKLKGKFVSLPDQGGPAYSGADVGMSIAGGRWLIDNCVAGNMGGQLSLHLNGPAWEWVQTTEQGFHIEQYVYVDVSVDLLGPLTGTYDANTKVASVFVLPSTQASVRANARLRVNAQPTGIISGIMDTFAPDTVNARVREAIEKRGSEQFTAQLSAGLTVTFAASGQTDLAMGQLPRGVVPNRPFRGPDPWFLNERQALHPGGITVAGPFAAATPVILDALIEPGGTAVRFHVYCSDVVVADYRTFLNGGEFVPLVARPESVWIMPGNQFITPIPPLNCPWVLATGVAPPPGTRVDQVPATIVRLQLRTPR